MKKLLIIWSFGTSDIKLDGEFIDGKYFRETTEKIKNDYNSYKGRITFPILDSFISQKIDENEFSIKIMGLFTNQEEGHQGDTIFLYDILAKYYKQPNITIIPLEKQILLTGARVFQNVYETIIHDYKTLDVNDYNKIYISPTGGTKGMVSALFVSSLEKLPLNKITFFYGEESENGDTHFIKQKGLILSLHKRFIKDLINNGDFDSVISYIIENQLEDFCNDDYQFAKYMHSRLNADYITCREISENEALDDRTRKGIYDGDMNLIEEKINGIIYTLRKGRYVEFFGRIYNFTDSIMTEKINKLYNHVGELKVGNIETFISQDKQLENFLDNYTFMNGTKMQHLKWKAYDESDKKEHMKNLTKKAILEYKLGKTDAFNLFLDRIGILNNYRNKTVIAHGNESINKKIITEKYGFEEIEKDFLELLNEECSKSTLWIDRRP